MNKANTRIVLNSTETLTATVTPENANNKDITWTSDDETVTTVENGTITALKAGTATITATAQDGSGVSKSCEIEVVKEGILSAIITGDDYGKNIDYSVTVKNRNDQDVTVDSWRVFYNDKTENKVYIIYDGYLPNVLIPTATGMTIEGTYNAYWENVSTNQEAVATLTNTTYWNAFAGGINNATATGGPTNKMFVDSWNENPAVNAKTLTAGSTDSGLVDSSRLYIPYNTEQSGCYGYRNASAGGDSYGVWVVDYWGGINPWGYSDKTCGIRPIVCLPTDVTGTVGTAVSIDN